MKKSYMALGVAIVIAIAVCAIPEANALTALPPDAFGPALLAAGVLGAPVTSTRIRTLQKNKANAVTAMRAMAEKAGDKAFSAEEQVKYDELKATRDGLEAAIAREAELIEDEQALGSVTLPAGSSIQISENLELDPKRGFATFGEYAQVVRAAQQNPSVRMEDKRMVILGAAPSTYGNEAGGADGGFLVPPQFSSEIFTLSLGEDSLVPYTDNTEVTGNSMVFPKDETTPWGTDGVRAYWQAEAAAATATKPKLGTQLLRLNKLMALVPVSDELMEDANALGSYLPGLCARSIRWKTNEAIVNGNGAGTPLGFLTGNCAVSVANGGAAANTVTPLNLHQMLSQLPNAQDTDGVVWMIHNTVIPALGNMTLGNYPMFQVMSGGPAIGAKPRFQMLGLPVIISQHCAGLTSAGDVLLVNLKWYRTITKAGGVQTATSMHLYFDADATAYRVTFRIDGRPKLAAPITQATGSIKLSPFLKLAAR